MPRLVKLYCGTVDGSECLGVGRCDLFLGQLITHMMDIG